MKGNRAMPAASVHLDQEDIFFPRSFPCASTLGQSWVLWPSLAAGKARKIENIIEFGSINQELFPGARQDWKKRECTLRGQLSECATFLSYGLSFSALGQSCGPTMFPSLVGASGALPGLTGQGV